MNRFTKRLLSWLMVLALCLSLLPGIALANQVDYQYGTASYDTTSFSNVIKNWGTRGQTATFLSPNAVSFYEANGTSYETLAALSGSASTDSVPSSALYQALKTLMTNAHTNPVSYDDTRALYAFTDCQGSDTNALTCFYSGTAIGPQWDAGSTWNREHTWPQSKGLSGSSVKDEDDIVMLRPTASSINSSRGNKAYGESSTCYDPNSVSGGTYNLRGDVARSVLYGYVRWDNTSYMWGSEGVIESRDLLLRWMQEDPVDTWEMGRNDSVESVVGTRNVFIDYPELAFALLGAEVPADMATPSGSSNSSDSGSSAQGGYVLVSDVAEVTAGGQFVIVATDGTVYNAMNTTLTSGKAEGVDVTVSGNTVTGTDLPVWTLEATDGGVAMNNGTNYLSYPTSGTNFTTSDTAYTWTVAQTEGGINLTSSAATTRGVMFRFSVDKFGGYAVSNASQSDYTADLLLFKYAEGGSDAPAVCEHNYTSVTTAAGCEAEGSVVYTCSLCGDSYTQTLPAVGHSYVDGTCTACGAVLSSYEGDYYIAAKRSSGNYFYMTNDLGTASTKRYAAVDSGLTELPAAITDGMPDRTFTLTQNSDGTYLIRVAGTEDYLGWTSGNSGALVAADSALSLTVEKTADATYTIVAASAEGRNLSLNSSNAYFAFYKGTQINDLYLIPVTSVGAACQHTNATVEGAKDAGCTTEGYTGDTVCQDCGEVLTQGESIPATDHVNNDGDNYCDTCGTQVVSDSLYTKATSIAIGDTVLLISETAAVELSGISTTSTKYGLGSAYTDTPVGLMPLTVVEGFEAGSYAFQTEDGNYLYWTSGNSLNVNATLQAKTSWNVTFDESGNASIFNCGDNARKIFWNNSSPRFACYTTTAQTSVQLYKLTTGTGEVCDHSSTTLINEKAATCTENGYTGDTTCTACGEIIAEGSVITAAGHSYVDGICSVCGALDPNYTVSDTAFVLVTDASQITAGGHFVIVVNNEGSNFAMPTTLESNKFVGTAVTVNGRIVTGENLPIWTIEAVDGGIALSANGSYLNYASSTNFKFADTAYAWALADGFVITSADAATTRGIYFQIESGKFGAYANSNATASGYISNLNLYKYQIGTQGCYHSYTETVTDATCTEDGVKTFTCILCDDTYTEAIPATGHNYVDNFCTNCGAVDPNADLPYYLIGYINGADYGCEGDYENMGQYKFVDGTLVATFETNSYVFLKKEHNAAWYMTQSYVETNVGTFYNTDTGASEKMLVPGGVELTFTLVENEDGSLTLSYEAAPSECNHNYTEEITDATCTKDGLKTYTCTLCGNVYTVVIPASGHNFVDGICTNCGEADPNYVDPADATYYLVGYINGADYGCEGDYENMGQYKFVDGTLVATFETNSYVFLKTEGNGRWLMANAYTEDTTCTFVEGASEKMLVPGGKELTFTLVVNEDGSVTVSYVAAEVEPEPSVAPTIGLKYPSVSFEDEVIMNVYFSAENLDDVVEMGLVVYNANVSEGNVETADAVVPGYEFVEAEGFYCAHTNGIAPKRLGDTLYFAVYAKLADGTYTYTRVVSYSPSTYAYAQLATGVASMKPLVVAMLNYGAEAQKYFNYNTENLVNAKLTDEQKALVVDYSADMMAAIPALTAGKEGEFAANGGFTRRYPTISFEGAFSINYYCLPANAPVGDITLYVWNEADFVAADVLTTDNATEAIKMDLTDSGEYLAVVDGIAAKYLDKGVYVSFVYSDGTTTYSTGVLAYSIGTYCNTLAAGTTSQAALAKATAVYGYYAKQLLIK